METADEFITHPRIVASMLEWALGTIDEMNDGEPLDVATWAEDAILYQQARAVLDALKKALPTPPAGGAHG